MFWCKNCWIKIVVIWYWFMLCGIEGNFVVYLVWWLWCGCGGRWVIFVW